MTAGTPRRPWLERYIAGEDVEPFVRPTDGLERDLIGRDGKPMKPIPFEDNPIVKMPRAAAEADPPQRVKLLGCTGPDTFILETAAGRGRALTVRRGVATLFPERYLATIIREPLTTYGDDAASIVALAQRVEREGDVHVVGAAKASVFSLAGVELPAAR